MPADSTMASDERIDPRIRAFLARVPLLLRWREPHAPLTRQQLVAEAASPKAVAAEQALERALAAAHPDASSPASIERTMLEFVSQPDGNTVKIALLRPCAAAADAPPLPLLVYLHGGGMMQFSAMLPNYVHFCKLLAARGMAVAAVEYRNCLRPTPTAPEIGAYPAGLNDCASAVCWLAANAHAYGVDGASLVLAGESGGANLALASALKLKRDGHIGLVRALYLMCPYIAGSWPRPELPSSERNNGIVLDLHSPLMRIAYGVEAFDAGDPLAWPLFASVDELRGLPPTVISVNECDPLRDEGVVLYRRLLAAGVRATARELLGTVHGIDVFAPRLCPDVTDDTVSSIAATMARVRASVAAVREGRIRSAL